MEDQVWVVLLMMPSEDPTLNQMNRQACELWSHEITPVPVTAWETSKEALIDALKQER